MQALFCVFSAGLVLGFSPLPGTLRRARLALIFLPLCALSGLDFARLFPLDKCNFLLYYGNSVLCIMRIRITILCNS